jgi:hypothetical protein
MALVHPSFFQPDDADNVTVPIALLPSQGEDQEVMNAFWERIQKKDIAQKSIRQDFVSEISKVSMGHSLMLLGSWTFTMALLLLGRTGQSQGLLKEHKKHIE